MKTTLDSVYGGHVKLHQLVDSYRAGLDAVFLGSAINAKPGQSILDVGCGVGTALLCALHHQPEAQGFGVDITPEFCELAHQNATENGRVVTISEGDILKRPLPFAELTFDHVLTNPPYHDATEFTPSPKKLKSIASGEAINGMAGWLDYCIKRLKPRGQLTMIHRTDRLDEILHHLWGRVGEIEIIPLFTQKDLSKRALIRGRKDVRGGLTLRPGITVHDESGYTKNTSLILSGKLAL